MAPATPCVQSATGSSALISSTDRVSDSGTFMVMRMLLEALHRGRGLRDGPGAVLVVGLAGGGLVRFRWLRLGLARLLRRGLHPRLLSSGLPWRRCAFDVPEETKLKRIPVRD